MAMEPIHSDKSARMFFVSSGVTWYLNPLGYNEGENAVGSVLLQRSNEVKIITPLTKL